MGIPLRAMQNGQRTEKADEYPNPHEQTRTQVGQLWPVIALGEAGLAAAGKKEKKTSNEIVKEKKDKENKKAKKKE